MFLNEKFVLASSSPRRKELLSLIASDVAVLTAPFEEVIDFSKSPHENTEILAFGKAAACFTEHKDVIEENSVLIASDTVVCLGSEILGKPKDVDDAVRILKRLSGKTHEVITGVSLQRVGNNGRGEKVCEVISNFHEITFVTFRVLSDSEIKTYLETPEPWDKAGSYGVQGIGGVFVSKISGNYHNVVGLPLAEIVKILSS